MIMKFKFDEYPELKKKYKELVSYEKKMRRTLNGTADDVDYWYNKIREFEQGEFPKMVFDTFNGKVDYLMYGETKTTWEETFGNDYSKLTENDKVGLTHLLDGDFILCLPREYYDDPYNEYPKCKE